MHITIPCTRTTSKKEGIEALVPDHDQMRIKMMNLIREKNYEYKAFPLDRRGCFVLASLYYSWRFQKQ